MFDNNVNDVSGTERQSEEFYTIQQFRRLNNPANMIVTQHSRQRFAERGINLQDVCHVIDSGEIIEEYPDSFPWHSCLILGESAGRYLHICASIKDGMLYLITAYVPNPDRWEPDLKTRKKDAQ